MSDPNARIEAFVALANAIIIIRRLLRAAWTGHRWDTRPGTPTLTYPQNLLMQA